MLRLAVAPLPSSRRSPDPAYRVITTSFCTRLWVQDPGVRNIPHRPFGASVTPGLGSRAMSSWTSTPRIAMRSSTQVSPLCQSSVPACESGVPLCTCLLEPRPQHMPQVARRTPRTVSSSSNVSIICMYTVKPLSLMLHRLESAGPISRPKPRPGWHGNLSRLLVRSPAEEPHHTSPNPRQSAADPCLPSSSTTHPSADHAIPRCVSASLDSRTECNTPPPRRLRPTECHLVARTSR